MAAGQGADDVVLCLAEDPIDGCGTCFLGRLTDRRFADLAGPAQALVVETLAAILSGVAPATDLEVSPRVAPLAANSEAGRKLAPPCT